MDYGASFATVFAEYLENEGYKYLHDEGNNIVIIRFSGGYESFEGITILMKFEDSGNAMQIQAPDFACVPERKRAQAIYACNEINERYRWNKFAIGKEGQVRIISDVSLDPEMGGNIVCKMIYSAMRRFIRIADVGYAMFCEYVDMNDSSEKVLESDGIDETQDKGLRFMAVNDEGEEIPCEAIMAFEHDGRNFIVYTDNSEDDEGKTRVYASMYEGTIGSLDDGGIAALGLTPITDDADWQFVEEALSLAVKNE